MKKEFKGNNQNGKGSKRRQENFRLVQENWDVIRWGRETYSNKKFKKKTNKIK